MANAWFFLIYSKKSAVHELTLVLWYIGAIIEMYLSMFRAIKLYELENRKLQRGILNAQSLHFNWSET